MRLGDGSLAFDEFASREPLPLARLQDEVIEFLRGRDDAVLFGSQAVNAYAREKRMSEDVDILSTRAKELADELGVHLAARFGIVVRSSDRGSAIAIDHVREANERHLVDVHPTPSLPPSQRVEGVLVPSPANLLAGKVMVYASRARSLRSGTDRRDIAALLLALPHLKTPEGAVRDRLDAANAPPEAIRAWESLVAEEIREMPDDAEFS